jgi:hypothetical protein
MSVVKWASGACSYYLLFPGINGGEASHGFLCAVVVLLSSCMVVELCVDGFGGWCLVWVCCWVQMRHRYGLSSACSSPPVLLLNLRVELMITNDTRNL